MDNNTPPEGYLRDSRYLKELLAERKKLKPFMHDLPMCSMLINKEITRMSNLISDQFSPIERRGGHGYPLRLPSYQYFNAGPMDLPRGSAMQTKAAFMGSNDTTTNLPIRKLLRLDIPVDKYPECNFVGRILGPGGNFVKRFQDMTGCKVYVNGRGSMKYRIEKEKLRNQPGYEHLNEALNLLIRADFTEDTIDACMEYIVSVLESVLKPKDRAP